MNDRDRVQQWEYCLLTCTPLTGLDEAGIRLTYQLATPEGTSQRDLHSEDAAPLAAIGRLLNELGAEGWELVAYNTTTNRGVFKRPSHPQGED
jgi:hypothetical protein